MATERHQIEVRGTTVEIVRKDIKNLHLAVYPPRGRVRVAVPLRLDDDDVRLAVITRFGWIRRRQAALAQQDRQTEPEMVTGESHYVQGRRFRLDVVEHDAPALVEVRDNRTLQLLVRRGTDSIRRKALLDRWYRTRLQRRIEELVAKWEPVIGVRVGAWRVRKMKTRWGTSNKRGRRICVNLELAKKPASCLEYIVTHEMVHLLVRNHDERFQAYMNRFMPQWRMRQDQLNRLPLAHESWDY